MPHAHTYIHTHMNLFLGGGGGGLVHELNGDKQDTGSVVWRLIRMWSTLVVRGAGMHEEIGVNKVCVSGCGVVQGK